MSDARLRELERQAWALRTEEAWTAWAGRVRAGVLVDQPALDPSWAHQWWVGNLLDDDWRPFGETVQLLRADPRPWAGALHPVLGLDHEAARSAEWRVHATEYIRRALPVAPKARQLGRPSFAALATQLRHRERTLTDAAAEIRGQVPGL